MSKKEHQVKLVTLKVSISSSAYDKIDHRNERRHYRDDSRSDRNRVRHRNNYESNELYSERDSRSRYDHEYSRKRNRYDGSRRTPGWSDWDDGRWEWEDTPRRESVASSRGYQPSPSPMFVGASPDARLVSPWSGGHTPNSSYAASPWDHVSPSPIPTRASGPSVKSSVSRNNRSHQLTFSSDTSNTHEDDVADKFDLGEEHKYEITESMRREMEYDADRAWYDQEEGSTIFDTDRSSSFLVDEASFLKREAELAKRLWTGHSTIEGVNKYNFWISKSFEKTSK